MPEGFKICQKTEILNIDMPPGSPDWSEHAHIWAFTADAVANAAVAVLSLSSAS